MSMIPTRDQEIEELRGEVRALEFLVDQAQRTFNRQAEEMLAAGAQHALDHHGAMIAIYSAAGETPGVRNLYQSCNICDWSSKTACQR